MMRRRELEFHVTGDGRQVVAGLLRISSRSVVSGSAKCNGRHAELVNKIKGPRFNAPTTNHEVGSHGQRRLMEGHLNWRKSAGKAARRATSETHAALSADAIVQVLKLRT